MPWYGNQVGEQGEQGIQGIQGVQGIPGIPIQYVYTRSIVPVSNSTNLYSSTGLQTTITPIGLNSRIRVTINTQIQIEQTGHPNASLSGDYTLFLGSLAGPILKSANLVFDDLNIYSGVLNLVTEYSALSNSPLVFILGMKAGSGDTVYAQPNGYLGEMWAEEVA